MYYALWPLWNYSLLRCEVKDKAVGLENLILQTATVGECAPWCVRQWNKYRQESVHLCLESPLILILWVVFPNWMSWMCQVLLGGERENLCDWFPGQKWWYFSGILSLVSWQPSKLTVPSNPDSTPLEILVCVLSITTVCHSFNGKENTSAHCRRKHNVLQPSPQS